MKMNITTDNYEAYLLDYMEGNLSPDETNQLKAFVAAQGLDWDELTAPLPCLEAPQTVYEDKEKLKKKGVVVPLYAKIASAAAVAGLLLTVSLWPEKSLPKVEPLAELKPILPGRLITASETTTLPPRTAQFVYTQPSNKAKTVVSKGIERPERIETPLVAELEPQKVQTLPTLQNNGSPDSDLLAYRMSDELAFAQIDENGFSDVTEDEHHLSLIGKGIYRLTEGRHDSFASLISFGLSKAKQDLTEAAADMALMAYHRAEERFEESKEYWEEKLEK